MNSFLAARRHFQCARTRYRLFERNGPPGEAFGGSARYLRHYSEATCLLRAPNSRRYRLLPQSICLMFLKLFERVYAPHTAGLLGRIKRKFPLFSGAKSLKLNRKACFGGFIVPM
jgi:hypothetical protein